MATWIIIGIVWLLVAAAFTIVMGVIHRDESAEVIDYMAFFVAYGIFWPVSLPLTGIGYILKWIVEKIRDRV